jgi:predicted permease
MTFLNDLKLAFRSLVRSKGLTLTVVMTLALGIGANAAIFSLVRGVLLRPLVNRDEDRLIYIRQTAPGLKIENAHFSVPEMDDLRSGVKSFSSFGDFSTIGFTMIGLGDPREVRAGVVGGSYFDVMGLHPVLGRLLGPGDDGPSAPGAMVLTYRFWSTVLNSDPSVLGKTVRLGSRSATVVGVLEPCVPYPTETEIIANIVTSPHHLSATMVQGRVHRMTELFGRLAPGATLDQARAELATVYANMVRQHPEAYSTKAMGQVQAVRLREQITSKASTVLWILLAASGLVFLIACSNVANLILARTVRRQGELAMRQALGAGNGALRRLLLSESLLLCGAGAVLGVLLAYPMVAILARYASRFSPRALDLAVDSSLLWVGGLLAIVAAVLLAYVPRLPQVGTPQGLGRGMATARITGTAGRRQQVFAITQIAASFILLAGAAMLLKTLVSLTTVHAGFETRRVLVMNVPEMSYGRTPEQVNAFYKEALRRVRQLPNVELASLGTQVPWRDPGFGPGFEFTVDGHVRGPGEEDPRGRFRTISAGYFASLGVPILSGRDFNDLDRAGSERVVIVTQSLAERLFPNGDAVNRHLMWTDPVTKFVDISNGPRRIVGVVPDIDDENIVPGPSITVFHPFGQEPLWTGRLFVRAHGDPYAQVTPVRKIIHDLSADQPVERAATLEDVRAEVLTPERLNTVVFGVFAAVALTIALVGVAGVLAFSVSGRTREFGIRLAMGSDPRQLVQGVLAQGAVMGLVGVVAGAMGGYALARLAASYFHIVEMPGATPLAGSAAVLVAAAVLASLLPALRASRVDVIQALRSE